MNMTNEPLTPFEVFKLIYKVRNKMVVEWANSYLASDETFYYFYRGRKYRDSFVIYAHSFQIGAPFVHYEILTGSRYDA